MKLVHKLIKCTIRAIKSNFVSGGQLALLLALAGTCQFIFRFLFGENNKFSANFAALTFWNVSNVFLSYLYGVQINEINI